MRCIRCNAELKHEGIFCNNCINEMNENEVNYKDTSIKFTVKRKYNFLYEVISYIEPILILLFMSIASIAIDVFSEFLYFLVFFIGVGIIYFFIKLRKIKKEELAFYDTKIVYKSGLFSISKTIKYKNIKDILVYPQTVIQKMFNVMDIEIKATDSNLILNKLKIKNVENDKDFLKKVSEIIMVKE